MNSMRVVSWVVASSLVGCATPRPRPVDAERFEFVPERGSKFPLKKHTEHKAPTSFTELYLRGMYVNEFSPAGLAFVSERPASLGLPSKSAYTIVIHPAHFHNSREPIRVRCHNDRETWYYKGDIIIRCGDIPSGQYRLIGPESVSSSSYMVIYSWRPIAKEMIDSPLERIHAGQVGGDELTLTVCHEGGAQVYETARWHVLRYADNEQVPGEYHLSDMKIHFSLKSPRAVDHEACD